jgi:hypothetical protein
MSTWSISNWMFMVRCVSEAKKLRHLLGMFVDAFLPPQGREPDTSFSA